MASSALWALGFAIGVVGWAALGWVIVHGARTLATALAARADTARELRREEEEGVAPAPPVPVAAPAPAAAEPEQRLAA